MNAREVMTLRLALRVLQLGAIVIVVAASTHTTVDLDRYLLPKELVLHLTAFLAGGFAWRSIVVTRRDRLLLVFLLLSAFSAALATNPWLGFRAFAISLSAVVLFLVARALREAGMERPLLNALAFAIVLASMSALLQAYGGWLPLFTENRAPGGTLGNRNFVAHAAAFGYPLVLLAVLRARRGYLFACAGLAIVSASLVLTRSRGAWLAFGAMLLVFLATMLVRRDHRAWARFAGALLFVGAGVGAALLLPNTLRWRSDNPYLDSLNSVANYQEGSGRGRLIQYQRSLLMAARHPILGVGPGNWAVDYPQRVTRRDPSLDPSESGMTANPWPSSDWIAFVAERGVAAALVLALFFSGLVRRRPRSVPVAPLDAPASPEVETPLTEVRVESGLLLAALLATIVASCVAGAFDAVLLLALPAFFVWTACGALGSNTSDPRETRLPLSVPIVLVLLLLTAAAVLRSGAQIASLELLSEGSPMKAARIDPGNYRAQLRLARTGPRRQRCVHALAARELYPAARAARDVSRGCD